MNFSIFFFYIGYMIFYHNELFLFCFFHLYMYPLSPTLYTYITLSPSKIHFSISLQFNTTQIQPHFSNLPFCHSPLIFFHFLLISPVFIALLYIYIYKHILTNTHINATPLIFFLKMQNLSFMFLVNIS